MAECGSVIPVQNETRSAVSRVTARGKRITYRLTVIQQPQRARACGSGAKSSADRRPVDPPPIIELKIFEGEPNNEEDITLNMNASYFLFAALEQARPIAQGRVQVDKDRVMALTGSSVAGMAYLDRPSPAGYFIFPDLSVRHEGKYRLSFSLYEGLKDPLDFDKSDETTLSANSDTGAYVSHRLEVKSEPFVVFSAKKFPGLTESTTLSRMVAEQGCRVRIRRDVRMRKRDSKPGKEWDEYENDTASIRASMSATPDASHHPVHGYIDASPRPRSTSNSSQISIAASLPRKPSHSEMAAQFHTQHYSAGPRLPQSAYAPTSDYNHNTQHVGQPVTVTSEHAAMQPPLAQYVHHHLPHAAYAPTSIAAGPSASAATLAQNNAHFARSNPALAGHGTHYATQPPMTYDVAGSPSRPSSEYQSGQLQGSNHYAMHPQPPNNFAHSQASHLYGPPASSASYNPHQAYPSRQSQQSQLPRGDIPIPPAINAHLPRSDRASSGILQVRPDKQLPPPQIPDHPGVKPIEPSSPTSLASSNNQYPAMEYPHKRGFGHVFNDRHLNQPLRDGARPNLAMYAESSIGNIMSDFAADDVDVLSDMDPSRIPMRYRRADGSSIVRELPPQTHT